MLPRSSSERSLSRHGADVIRSASRHNVPLQPRRFTITPSADGCKRVLGRYSNDFRKVPRGSKNSCDFYDSGAQAIDDPVRGDNDLSDFRILSLWHDSAGCGEGVKPFDGGDDSPRDEFRVHRRVLRYECANRFDVPKRLWRPRD